MANWYVSGQRGDDTNAGNSQSAPFATLGKILNTPTAKTITNIVVSSNVATCNCTGHGYTAGWQVYIAGMTDSYFNTYWTITSVPDADSFTFTVSKADGTYTGGSPTARAPVMGPFDVVYCGPDTYRERITLCNLTEWSAGIQSSGGLVRSSNVVTVTAASAGAFAGLSAGMTVVISGSTSQSFDGIFTIASVPDSSTFTYAQAGQDEISGGGTVYGYRRLVFDPDCRYLTSDKPGVCRLTGANSSEVWTSGIVFHINSANQFHIGSYDDAYEPNWACTGSSDNFCLYGGQQHTLWRTYITTAYIYGYYTAYQAHVSRCILDAVINVDSRLCMTECFIRGAPVTYSAAHCCNSRGSLSGGATALFQIVGTISIRAGAPGDTNSRVGSALIVSGTNCVSGTPKIFLLRSTDVAAETTPTYPASIATNGVNYTILGETDRTTTSHVRNAYDVGIAVVQGTYTYSVDLSSACTYGGTPAYSGYMRGAFIYVSATDGSGSVTVALQKYVSGSWTTQRYKTTACSSLSTGWQYFEFDSGSGDAYITKTASLWRLYVSHSGSGTGTTIGTGTSGSRTNIANIWAAVPLVVDTSLDFDGRWRPAYTYIENYKHMIGAQEFPDASETYTAGEYYSKAPGIVMQSPGDEIVSRLPVRGGVSTTVSCYCKQSSCDSARLPQLVVWGNGLGTALTTSQIDTKANDSDWEQLSVTFTPDQDGVVIVVARHRDYTSGTKSYWSDWAVSES